MYYVHPLTNDNRFRNSFNKSARGTSSSFLVVTSRNFTIFLCNSDSPKIITNGILCSSQYCNCANNFGFLLYECSTYKQKGLYNLLKAES